MQALTGDMQTLGVHLDTSGPSHIISTLLVWDHVLPRLQIHLCACMQDEMMHVRECRLAGPYI